MGKTACVVFLFETEKSRKFLIFLQKFLKYSTTGEGSMVH